MSRKFRRTAGVVAALMLTMPTVLAVGSGGAAHARPKKCTQGDSRVAIVSMKRPVFLTHVKGFQAPPGGELTISKTLTSTAEMTATAEAYGEVSAEAGAIFGKVSAKAGFKVARQGKKTDSTSETVTHRLSASKKDRYYAAYVGTTKVVGRYKTQRCLSEDAGWGSWKYGDYQTFKPVTIEGVALCKHGRYKSGTAPYVACQASWGN